MVPKLRFKEFCGEWIRDSISNLCEIIDGDRGKNYPKEKDFLDQGYCLFLNAKNVTKEGFKFNEKIFISKERDNLMKKGKLQKEDLVVTSRGTIGNVAYFSESIPYKNIRINSGMLIIRANKILSSYLYEFMKSSGFKKQIKLIISGNAQPQLTLANFNNLQVEYSSLPEQTKIADFLSTVDDKIQNQQDKITHLENIKKGFMQKIFSRKIRFKDDGGEEFPEWEEKKLGDIADLLSSKRIYLDDYVEKGVPFFRGKEISELKNNKKIEDLIFITKEKYNEIKEKYGVPQKNDLLITAVGTLGNTLIIQDENPFYFKDGNLIWLKDISQNVVFLDFLLNSQNGKKLILNSAIGSTQKALTIIELNKLKFKFPCLKEQKKIANFLSSFDEKISTEKDTLEHIKQLKKGLLQQMFV